MTFWKHTSGFHVSGVCAGCSQAAKPHAQQTREHMAGLRKVSEQNQQKGVKKESQNAIIKEEHFCPLQSCNFILSISNRSA